MSQFGVYRIHRNREELVCSTGEEVLFGRSALVHVKVDDLRCSGIHALLEQTGSRREFRLVDLGSDHGTFVKGHRVDEIILRPKEQFSIGNASFVVKKVAGGGEVSTPQPLTTEPLRQLKMEQVRTKKTLLTELDVLQVKLFWGTHALDVRTFKIGSDITLGADKSDTFSVIFKDKTLEHFKVASYRKGILTLSVPKEGSGLVWMGKDVYNIDALRFRPEFVDEHDNLKIVLRLGDRANLHFGELSLHFDFVDPAEAIPIEPLSRVEKPLRRIFVSSLIIFALLFLALSMFEAKEEVKTLEDVPKHLKKVIFDAGIQQAMKKRKAAIGQLVKTVQGGRARSEEGQSSARKSPTPKEVQKEVKKVAKVERKSKVVAPKLDLDSVFSRTSTTKKVSRVSIKGPSKAGNTASALSKGNFARSNKGLGAGGGGQSVGIGELQGLNTGGGIGTQDFGTLPSKGREIVVPEIEEVIILGGLDPDVIAAIIRRYLAQIQHCYEQQLVHKPNLKGKVTVSFIIGGNGLVKTASIFESSLKNAKVEACMVQKISKWKFPKPKGGGTVGVKYPFLLMSNSSNGG